MDKLKITSLQNPKIKNAIKLKDKSAREETGFFLIEGYREIKRAQESEIPIRSLFICPELFLGINEPELIENIKQMGSDIFSCTSSVFHKLSYRDRPDGLVAMAQLRENTLVELTAKMAKVKDPFIVIAESIEKPGNLGSILRSSDAAGVNGLIVCDKCTDIYNPNVIRASIGTLFTVPLAEAQGSEALYWLRNKKIKIIAATPSAKTEFTEADLTGPIAIVVGTEQLGLTDLWMSSADIKVKIPMNGVADSLNVATATTLLLYEVLRQRKSKKEIYGSSLLRQSPFSGY